MNLKDIAQLVTDKISSRQVTLQDYVTTAFLLSRNMNDNISWLKFWHADLYSNSYMS